MRIEASESEKPKRIIWEIKSSKSLGRGPLTTNIWDENGEGEAIR